MAYRYETHLHTKEGSACGRASARDYATLYKKHGYAGVFITDHFYNGNTAIPRELPWREWVEAFCKPYEALREEGERIGLSVFFGWEATYEGNDFLIYGLDKEWLIANPEAKSFTIQEQYEAVTAAGGMVVHAHPYLEAPYISCIRLFPDCEDAIEVFNVSNEQRNPKYNRLSEVYARENGKPMTGGSDIHSLDFVGGGVAFDTPLTDVKDYIKRIKSGKGYEVLRPQIK